MSKITLLSLTLGIIGTSKLDNLFNIFLSIDESIEMTGEGIFTSGILPPPISEKSSSEDKRRRIYEPTEQLIKDFIQYSNSIYPDNRSTA